MAKQCLEEHRNHLKTQGRLSIYNDACISPSNIIIKSRNILEVYGTPAQLNTICEVLTADFNINKRPLCDLNLQQEYPELLL